MKGAIVMSILFELGQLVGTAGVAEAMGTHEGFRQFVYKCLERYITGDWGELEEPDKELNDESVAVEGRILASYDIPADVGIDYAEKIWIITEWDRSVTTILFPDEY